MAIDFTNFERKNKTYAGANGSKISVVYNGRSLRWKQRPTGKGLM